MAADLFISIHHDSVPDYLLQTWEYDGQQNHFNDSFKGYAIFVSNENADRAGSLMFGRLLGERAASARSRLYAALHTGADATIAGASSSTPTPASTDTINWSCSRKHACRRCCSKPDRSSTGRRNWNWRSRAACAQSAAIAAAVEDFCAAPFAPAQRRAAGRNASAAPNADGNRYEAAALSSSAKADDPVITAHAKCHELTGSSASADDDS